MEKLDRAFAIVDWINTYPQYTLHNQPILRSDHGAILLDLENKHPFRIKPFRFEKMWINHDECHNVVQNAWRVVTNGSRAFQLQNKLTNVRKQFIEWNRRRVFGRVEKEIRAKQKLLQNMQDSIHTLKDVRKEKELRENIEDLLTKEEIKWAQKARSDWII